MKANVRELLSAYLDGELTPKQRGLVEKVLRQSDKARALLADLQSNAERLHSLPRESLPADFSTTILTEIHNRRIRIDKPHLPGQRDWRRLALAASVMIAVGLGTAYLVHQWRIADGGIAHLTPDKPDQPADSNSKPNDTGTGKTEVKKVDWEKLKKTLPSKEEFERLAAQGRLIFEPIGEGVIGAFDGGTRQLVRIFEVGPGVFEPPFAHPGILTSPFDANKRFKTVDVNLPLFMDVAALDEKKLLNRLDDESLFHLDFSCDQASKSLERLQNACKSSGVKLVIDGEVKQRLDRKMPVIYMIYLENITAEQMVKILKNLQAEEKKAEAARKGDSQFETLMLQSLDNDGRKHLADSLGVPLNTLAPPKPRPKLPPTAVDPTKPIWHETLKMLDKLVAGQGGVKAAPQKEPTAVVGVYIPSRARMPFGKEVKQFLDTRPEWRPDLIHVVMLLRPQRG